jgi:hypothetical protein
VRQSASSASIATKSAFAGIKAGLKSLGRPRRKKRSPSDLNQENLRSSNLIAEDLDENDISDQERPITPNEMRSERSMGDLTPEG